MKHSLQLIVTYTTLLPCFVIGPPMSSALDDLIDVTTFATIDGFKRNILLTQVEDKHLSLLLSYFLYKKIPCKFFCFEKDNIRQQNTFPSTTSLFFCCHGSHHTTMMTFALLGMPYIQDNEFVSSSIPHMGLKLPWLLILGISCIQQL